MLSPGKMFVCGDFILVCTHVTTTHVTLPSATRGKTCATTTVAESSNKTFSETLISTSTRNLIPEPYEILRRISRQSPVTIVTQTPTCRQNPTTASPKPHHSTIAQPDPDVFLQPANGTLVNVGNDSARLTVTQVIDNVNEIIGLYDNLLDDLETAENFFKTIGWLSRKDMTVSVHAERNQKTSSRLRQMLDSYTTNVNLEKYGGLVSIPTNELEVTVVSVQTLGSYSEDASNTLPVSIIHGNKIRSGLKTTLILPQELFTEGDNQTRIQFIGYRTSQLFVPEKGLPAFLYRQRVVSASVKDKEIRNLKTPVQIRLPKIQPEQKHAWVFWDNKRSDWSSEGVTLVSEDFDSLICHSFHLTSFALLMNVGNVVEDKVLTYPTYIGCGVSMVFLLMTIVTYSIFRCLNEELAGKLLLSLCVALLSLNVTFLAATVDVSGYSEIACVAAGMLLHYCLLASMIWMLIDAVELYQALVTLFRNYERYYKIKRCVLAWGTPAITVALTTALNTQSYSMNQHDRKLVWCHYHHPGDRGKHSSHIY